MAMSLAEFVKLQRKRLVEFERYWRENNAKHPDMFPVEMDDDNVGLWFEQFHIFDEGNRDG
jgi:hypothetical protein